MAIKLQHLSNILVYLEMGEKNKYSVVFTAGEPPSIFKNEEKIGVYDNPKWPKEPEDMINEVLENPEKYKP